MVWILVYGAMVWKLSLVFLNHSDVNLNVRASMHSMIEGNAHKPFVYRRLLPFMVSVGRYVTPDGVQDRVEAQWARSSTMDRFREVFHIEDGYLYEGVLTFAFMVLFLLMYTLALKKLGREILGLRDVSEHFVPIFGLLVLPPFFSFGYIYDFPVLGLSAVCYLYLYRQHWLPYLVFFALACLNKETTLLFGVVYGLTMMNRLPAKPFFLIGGAQALIFTVIRGGMLWRFRDNYGENMRDHLDWQLRSLLEPYCFLSFLGLVGCWVLLASRWGEKPDFLKRAVWMIVPLGVLYLFGGGPGEIRVFYENVPILVLLMSHTLLIWTGWSHSLLEAAKMSRRNRPRLQSL